MAMSLINHCKGHSAKSKVSYTGKEQRAERMAYSLGEQEVKSIEHSPEGRLSVAETFLKVCDFTA